MINDRTVLHICHSRWCSCLIGMARFPSLYVVGFVLERADSQSRASVAIWVADASGSGVSGNPVVLQVRGALWGLVVLNVCSKTMKDPTRI